VDATLNMNPICIENKAQKPLAKVREAEHCPGYVFTEYSQTDGFCRRSILESKHKIVLHRPVEPARVIGNIGTGRHFSGKRVIEA
jgi:hypothetical protein